MRPFELSPPQPFCEYNPSEFVNRDNGNGSWAMPRAAALGRTSARKTVGTVAGDFTAVALPSTPGADAPKAPERGVARPSAAIPLLPESSTKVIHTKRGSSTTGFDRETGARTTMTTTTKGRTTAIAGRESGNGQNNRGSSSTVVEAAFQKQGPVGVEYQTKGSVCGGRCHDRDEQKGQQEQKWKNQRNTADDSNAVTPPSVASPLCREHCRQQCGDIAPAKAPSTAGNRTPHGFSRAQGGDTTKKKAVPRPNTAAAVAAVAGAGSGNKHISRSKGRSMAALGLQRVFRGHRGRESAAAECRKRARLRMMKREEMGDSGRPVATSQRLHGRIPRPKLPSTYGF